MLPSALAALRVVEAVAHDIRGRDAAEEAKARAVYVAVSTARAVICDDMAKHGLSPGHGALATTPGQDISFAPQLRETRGPYRPGAAAMATIFVAFGVVAFWRGLWLLWDAFTFPGDPVASAWASLATGTCVLVLARAFHLALAPPLTQIPFSKSRRDCRASQSAKRAP